MAIVAGAEKVLISSVTASAASAIDFTSGIDTTYDEYEIHLIGLRFSVDSGSFFGFMSDDGLVSSATAIGTRALASYTVTEGAKFDVTLVSGNLNTTYATNAAYRPGNAAGESLSGIIRIYAPADSTTVCQWSAIVAYTSASGNINLKAHEMSADPAAGAIDSVRVYPVTGTVTGEARLYGIAKSV